MEKLKDSFQKVTLIILHSVKGFEFQFSF